MEVGGEEDVGVAEAHPHVVRGPAADARQREQVLGFVEALGRERPQGPGPGRRDRELGVEQRAGGREEVGDAADRPVERFAARSPESTQSPAYHGVRVWHRHS